MKRLTTILILLASIAKVAYTQQMPLYTQYMYNPFIINPAVTGTLNFFQIKLTNRFQWIGVPDGPVTNALSVYGPISSKSKNMGYGASLYSDVVGPTSIKGFQGAYAYNRAINDQIRVSGGISVGILQYMLDGNKIYFKDNKGSSIDNTDVALSKSANSSFTPDVSMGLYMYSTNFYVGLSSDKLFSLPVLKYDSGTGLNKLRSHFYLMGAYIYKINRKWTVEPGMLLKYVSPAPPQLDFNVKGTWQNLVWCALSVRTMDAISIMGGYLFNKRIYIGYAYDYNINPLNAFSYGSHELMLGYRFNTLK